MVFLMNAFQRTVLIIRRTVNRSESGTHQENIPAAMVMSHKEGADEPMYLSLWR